MGQTERILRMQLLLQERKLVPKRTFLDEFEISEAQFKRDLAFLRDRFRVRIEYDPARRGYFMEGSGDESSYELPGPMYTASEIHALLLMQDLVSQLQPGLLDEHLAPVRERLKLLLGSSDLPADEIRRRIRILHMASRPVEPRHFRAVSQATLARQRLHIRYHTRSSDSVSERDISPQRLVFYRGNWYVDAWCHMRQDLRSFAVDAIQDVELLAEPAREILEDTLDAHLGAGYGIFSGAPAHHAVLRFDPESARWVSREIWHSGQTAAVEASGHLVLTVPYAQERELLMDIVRWGSHVEVIAPESLRDLVKSEHRAALGRYN
jgi:predicted DNA-binding transcriptional regulator YafY